MESPRAVPPNLSAAARLEYGVPPRCCGLCCQLLPLPARFPEPTRLPLMLLMFVLRLKLLFRLMLMSPPPQPQPQPQPPPQAAPIAKPTPNEMALAAITPPVGYGG